MNWRHAKRNALLHQYSGPRVAQFARSSETLGAAVAAEEAPQRSFGGADRAETSRQEGAMSHKPR